MVLLIEALKSFDRQVFIFINSETANPVFDLVMPLLRQGIIWSPLYLFLLFFVTLNFRTRGWWWCLGFICVVAITDMTSSRVIKEIFERPRPCFDPDFSYNVRFLLKHCSGAYSFTSSHAANHFGMAAFFFFTFRHIVGRWAWLAFVWAFAVSYAQVYVGVHYPSDILGGALLGIGTGWLLASFFHKKFGYITFDKQPTVA